VGKQVILINGKKRSGKDFTAKLLQEQLGDKAIILSFAEPLKQIIATTFGITMDELDVFKNNPNKYKVVVQKDTLPNINNTNFREILQIFGTEAMQSVFGNMVWVDLLLDKISKLPPSIEYVIISDWRRLAEYTGIKGEHKVTTIKVNGGVSTDIDTHISETALDTFPFHYILDNSVRDGRLQVQVKELNATAK